MVKLKGDKEIGDKINKIISKLAEANDLKGVIDVADFNDEDKLGKGQDMQDRLSKLVGIFEKLDFSANRAEGDDLLGDAYEYLMRHFATELGKSKGQFYTPAEVSRIMANVIGIGPQTRQDQSIYDPTCGSGSPSRAGFGPDSGHRAEWGSPMNEQSPAERTVAVDLESARYRDLSDSTLEGCQETSAFGLEEESVYCGRLGE